jgi:hypothetical protein
VVRRVRRSVSVIGEDLRILVSALGMERRGNRAFCHCEERSDEAISACS